MATYYEQITGAIRSPMEYQQERMKRQADIQRMQDEQDLMKQRKNILQQFFQPAVAERQELAPVGVNPLAALMQPEQPANMVESRFAGVGRPADAGSIIPQYTSETIPGKKEVYDPRGAMGALFGIGDIDTAKSIANIEYKQNLMGGGQEKYSMTGRLIKLPDGSIVERRYSNRGDYKDTPVSGELVGQLQKVDLGGQQQLINPYTGEVIREESVTATPYQSFQMSPDAQADVAEAEAAARKRGEMYGTKEAGAESKIETLDKTIDLVGQLLSHPGRKAATGATFAAGYIPSTEAYDFNQLLDQLTGQSFLAEVEKMRGLGTLTETEGKKLTVAAAALKTSQTEAAFDRNLRAFQSELERARNKTSAKMGGAPSRPAPAPKPAPAKMPSMPPAKAHSGRTVRDTDTGITYKSDGMKWVRVK